MHLTIYYPDLSRSLLASCKDRLMSTSPICEFLCGPPDPSNYFNTLCLAGCQARANCALTPNILFTFIDAILINGGAFFTGTQNIIIENLSSLAWRVALYQQIPWLLGFSLIMIILAWGLIISPLTAFLFILGALIVAGVFVVITLTDTRDTLERTQQDLRNQLKKDYTSARQRLNQDIAGPLAQAIAASQVPCGCSCPLT